MTLMTNLTEKCCARTQKMKYLKVVVFQQYWNYSKYKNKILILEQLISQCTSLPSAVCSMVRFVVSLTQSPFSFSIYQSQFINIQVYFTTDLKMPQSSLFLPATN